MNVCYYILKNTKLIKNSKVSEIGDLTDGVRIISIDTNYPIITGLDFEGPYFDIKGLVENSKTYLELKKTNSKRAHKIIQKEYIIKPEGTIMSPSGRKYNIEFFKGYIHSILGEFSQNEVTGIHFYDKDVIKILEILDENDKGVWRAKIKVLNPYTKEWNKKVRTSDFFPTNWNRSMILDELYFAFNNKKLKFGTDKVYEAFTKSGIKVVFIINNGKIKTIYPVLN